MRRRRQATKPALEVIEEGIHLLRTSSVSDLSMYYLGALPFALGWLYFWTDMSRSAFASSHLAEAALGLAALFLWMKFWQGVFCANLRSRLIGEASTPLTFRRCRRILFTQTALQPAGLFLLPVALFTILPFPWVYAFFQTVSARADAEPGGFIDSAGKSWREARMWPGQNLAALAIMAAFGVYVFLNWATVCFILPGLVKILFGIESVFTRSTSSLLNTTFFAAMFWLTYLCVDPILKAVYTLRCFYGESRQSGDDLKAELRQFTLPAKALATGLVVIMVACTAAATRQDKTTNGHEWTRMGMLSPLSDEGTTDRSSRTRFASVQNITCEESIRVHSCPFVVEVAGDSSASPQPVQPASRPAQTQASPPSISPPQLDQAIQDTIQRRKYSWRAPRTKVEKPETASGNGFLTRFFERVHDMVGKWFKAIGGWLDRLMRKLFGSQRPTAPSSSGYNWILLLQFLLWVLAAAVIAGIVVFLYRIVRDRRRKESVIASEPILPIPDLTDESIGAEQLPEDGWTKLARELLGRGEFRLAIRAFYLASLANLAARNLITLAKFKSNRDYERELGRRGHAFPALLSLFGQNVSVFDRIWYGLHDINGDLVNQFATNVERIKSAA